MATNTPMECGVCHEGFNEDERCPRILPCYHTLCAECINQLIRNNSKRCPFCREIFGGSSSTDLVMNRLVLDIIRFMSAQISLSKTSLEKETSPDVENGKDITKEAATTENLLASYKNLLKMSGSLIEVTEEMKTNLHQQCNDIEDKISFKLKEMIQSRRRCIDDLNSIQNQLSMCMEKIKKQQVPMENCIERLNKVSTLTEAASLLDEAENVNITSEWIETFNTLLNKNVKNFQEIAKAIKSEERKVMYVLRSFEDRQEEKESCVDCLDLMSSILLRPLNRQATIFQELLITQEKVFAVQEQNGITRSARITFGCNKLFLHHLKKEPPPENSFLIEHEAALSLVNYSSNLVFLDLGACESTLGRLLIRLSPDTKRARNFSLLCTGEIGPSYANTKIFELCGRGTAKEYVHGGDYELNTGDGGKPLVKDLATCFNKRKYVGDWKAGTVCAYCVGENVTYVIYTKDFNGCVSGCIGLVEKGIDVLREAITVYEDISNVEVQDCGVVLSYSSP